MPDFDVMFAELSEAPISVDQAIAAVEGNEAGAVVSFSGVVRNHDGGKAVDRLSYTAHPTARQVLAEVVAELIAEHSGEAQQPVRVWAAHRLGMLDVGDPALVCAVSAAHRGQAFAVCSELVDRIKARVPIWKEQFLDNGAVEWVGAEDFAVQPHESATEAANKL
ncbi:molybdenum cofactor biosynthesis protein MoaE [Arthrobacter sp. ISL-72]|uniref:molybdenum cofactor biosynthesis protein MoaE n=1 Tax=Arthrobacter sp. ISL-72 TaxID=2819114 RepID=UPI001BE8488E|nr:molybdenum cofactor biosynthesis protein MoaE [Arthrobacter sp. ISL-72]MBT2593826.1 molybdenum cofactor biosynthesis protein MoaE [Arthrobacter sp. ISL-72]